MKIEKRLRLLASQNANYAPLLAQWEFDKRLLSRALSTVSNNFPHYSLHDESHSSTIINQIEKVISPNIDLLSATDCWLLLEACYWHDSGMIINHDEKKNLVNEESFLLYLQELSLGNGEFSKDAESILKGINAGDIDKLLNDSQYLLFIIADYYRSKHAFRSEEHVNNPHKIGVNSPRTHLIPHRLISLLAKICSCHGKNPESVLELPQSSDGMDSEDYAHPRYIAALLRIGDLLDIDDGRFCETLLRNISGLPLYSSAHKRKHESVQQLYIDSRVVEIKAKCQDYESFAVQQAWFDYIQTEFDYQKRVWNDIVPNQAYTSLPTVNNISCEIIGYITVNGKVPKVTLNKDRIYQYLTGRLLYRYSTPFIRELIQNSIDAVHYKIWAKYFYDDKNEHYIGSKSQGENRKQFSEKLKLEKITINLLYSDDQDECYVLTIKDTGMGMGLSDIEKIINVGDANKGIKNAIISSMPDWAKPSGYFGIGFQSVFDASDKVVIETRKDGESGYQIEFNKTYGNIPSVGIKTINKKWFEGTNISIHLSKEKSRAISRVISFSREIEYRGAYGSYHVDPLIRIGFNNEEKLLNLRDKLAHHVNETFKNVGMRIEVQSIKDFDFELEEVEGLWETDYDIGVDYRLYISNNRQEHLSFYYRGAIVESHFARGMLKGDISIFVKSADEWLAINRDGVRGDKQEDVMNLVDLCVERNKEKIYEMSEDKKMASLYLSASYNFESELWRGIIVNGHSLGDMFDLGVEVVCGFNSELYDENICEVEGSEYNTIDVIYVFSLLVIKKGAIPIVEYVDSDGKLSTKLLRFKVVKEIDNEIQYVSSEMVKDNISRYSFLKNRRSCALCYSEKYSYISLRESEMPIDVHLHSPSSSVIFDDTPWTRYIFLPYAAGNLKFSDEVDLILTYFSKIGNNLDKEIARQLFRAYWQSLDVMPEE